MNASHKRLIWSENTFLSPQHLQQWDEQQEAALAQFYQLAVPDCTGLIHLIIDEVSLQNGNFTVREARWLMPNGTIININNHNGIIASIDVQSLGLKKTAIYLCCPINNLATQIPGYPEQINAAWVAHYKTTFDLYDSGREAEVGYLMRQLYLKTSEESRDQFFAIKIAEIVNEMGQLSLIENYIPPIVHIKSSRYLMDLTWRIIELATSKARILHDRRAQFRGQNNEFSHADLSHFILLQQLNQIIPRLLDCYEHPKQSPKNLYLILSELNTMLTTFTNDYLFLDIPKYDHDDLRQVFNALEQQTMQLLEIAMPNPMTGLKLVRESDAIYEANSIESKLLKNHRFFLAVSFTSMDSNWVNQFSKQIKIASRNMLETLVNAALPGLKLIHTQRPPNKLVVKTGYEYFYIEPQGPLWEKILEERNIAVFIPFDFWTAQLELIHLQEE